MKFCEKCGEQLLDEAVMCPKCKNMISKVSTNADHKKATLDANKRVLLLLLGIGILVATIIAVAYQI